MRWFQNLPIKQKLLTLMVITSTVTLLAAGTVIIVVEFYSSRSKARADLAVVADAIEYHEGESLATAGAVRAARLIAGLRAYPSVASGCLYDNNGALLASYRRSGLSESPTPAAPPPREQGLMKGYLYVSRPILYGGRPIGRLFLSMKLSEVDAGVLLYARIVAMVLVGAGLIAFLTSAAVRRLVARPILELSAAAEAVARGEWKTRVEPHSVDEVGRLAQAFNLMTEQLEALYGSLEQRVEARTQELAATNTALSKEVVERRRIEEALQKEQQLLEAFMENVPDAIYFKDKSCRFIRVNSGIVRKFACRSAADVLGKTDFDFFTTEHAQQAYDDEQQVIRTGKPLLRYDEKETWPGGHVTWVSTTKMPLRDSRGKIVGTFGISTDITQRRQAEDALAERTAQLREKHEQIQTDLSIAREFQLAFLPQKFPGFPPGVRPEESALRFCSRYRPSGTVGGDFYDILPLSGSAAGVFVCDVMGHGVRAALVTAIVRGLVAELKPVATDPGRLLAEINRTLVDVLRQTDSTIFATAFYMVVDTANGSLRYACAGHPRPFHIRRAVKEVVLLELPDGKAGPVLGLFAESQYQTAEAAVAAHDAVMLFTDGLYEVAGADGDYGKERLLAAVRQRMPTPTERLFDEVLAEIQGYGSVAGFTDDVCVVGVDITRVDLRSA